MTTHSSILAWRILSTEEPGGLQSIGSHRVKHGWSNLNVHWQINGYRSFDTSINRIFSSVQSLIYVKLFVTPWTAAHQASLSSTNSRSLLRLMSIELVMSSNHLILCRPLLLSPSIFPNIRIFSNKSALRISDQNIGVSASTSVLPVNIQDWFPLDWLDLLAVQGTLKSLLQHHSSKTSILCSAFFVVQLSHPYMTTGKNSQNGHH